MDLAATKSAVSICKEVLELNPAKKFLLIPNRVRLNTSSGRELRSALLDWGPFSKATLNLRVAYSESAAEGLGITQYAPKSSAAQEIGILAEEVSKILAIK